MRINENYSIALAALWRKVLKSMRLRREEDLPRCDYACAAQVYRRNTPAFRVPRPP